MSGARLCLQCWETLVIEKLRWDLSAVTPHDFLEQILSRLPLTDREQQLLKRHAQTFISLCIATGQYSFTMASSPPVSTHSLWRHHRLADPGVIGPAPSCQSPYCKLNIEQSRSRVGANRLGWPGEGSFELR